ncbi:MAG TPA: response regulator [Chthoniobacteraceae bacterium]|jgi:CheY-like chemotaxis protein|nr:response regulator [Chthoniobacteraceae bacterium]
MKILVVEDEPASLKLAHLVLSSDGHEVATAAAVEQALREIEESEPEVLLLDLELPNINGIALARSLKNDPKHRHIVIVAVTAYPERFPREDALAAGCDAYLVKPIDTRKLTAQVASAVEQRS